MLFFAHIGITLGAGLAATKAWRRVRRRAPAPDPSPRTDEKGSRISASLQHDRRATSYELRVTAYPPSASFSHRKLQHDTKISYKQGLLTLAACVIGSLLPDIIDKPLGHFLLPGFFGYNGRIMAHTLVFLLLVLSVGLSLYPRRLGVLVLILAYGDGMHLVLDQMWQTPQTLLWPLLGWSFPSTTEYPWLGTMWNEYFHDPSAYVPELIGLGILCLCGLWFFFKQRRGDFHRPLSRNL
jgi:inner membrane protein